MKNRSLPLGLVLLATGCAPESADQPIESSSSAITAGAVYNLKLSKMSGDTGNCVDVTGKSTASGANIEEWDCNGSVAQEFIPELVTAPYYRFKNTNSGLCLNIYAGAIDATHPVSGNVNGANIQQWTCSTGDNNLWELVSYNGGYQFKSKLASGDGIRRCLDVTGGDTFTANGTNIELWTCGGSGTTKGNQTVVPVAVTGSSGGGSNGNFPARFSAPYLPTWTDTNLANLASSTDNKFWTLAFVIPPTGGGCTPTWNGDTGLTGNSYGSYISGLRAAGGDVIVSFGGAEGGELGKACTSVSSLQAAYQTVIDQFHLTWLDFDIESGLEDDTTSVDRRNKAIHNLQVANPGLRIDYTLAVERTTGLPSGPKNVLSNAKANGVTISNVNIMAMDYGACYSDMGQAAIDAAKVTWSQLGSLGISAKVGVTPMIGVNDVTCQNFTTTDASTLVSYAQANSYISLLAYWEQSADPNHSYINVFKTFH